MSPQVNYGLQVRISQRKFTDYSKCYPLGTDILLLREDMKVWGHGVYEDSLYLPIDLAVNLKLF